MSKGVIKKVAGPLVIATGMRDANMGDVVRVSSQRLIGEIIEMHGDQASIQVYEETSGLGPGEPVESTDSPLSVELGPGLMGSIYDGIQRPLNKIMEKTHSNLLSRGVEVPALDREKKWEFHATAQPGEEVEAGDILGTVQETTVVEQKIMVPYGVKGTLKSIQSGSYTVEETIAVYPVVKSENPALSAEINQPHGSCLTRLKTDGRAGGNIQPLSISLFPVKLQPLFICFIKMVLGTNLYGSVSDIRNFQFNCLISLIIGNRLI